MSDPVRIAVFGLTGLVGNEVLRACVGREDVRLTGIARREAPLPTGIRMELFVAEPEKWGEVIEAVQPRAAICALGTTWKKAGEDEAAFRAVDHDLVLAVAEAAKQHGVERFVHISSAGAATSSSSFYLRVKGEIERDLSKLRFGRLDILRPGLLRGRREADHRPAERLGVALAPLVNPLLHGRFRPYRAIHAETVADAALALAKRAARGRFVHDNDGILRAARALGKPEKD